MRRVACLSFVVALITPGLASAADTPTTTGAAIEGTYRSMGTDAEIRVRHLSGDTYYLVASDGWEAIGIVDRGAYRGVFHYNAPRDSSRRGVTGVVTFDASRTTELHVRTSLTGQRGESTDLWKQLDRKPPPLPSGFSVPVIPPPGQDAQVDVPPKPILTVDPECPDIPKQAGVDGTVTINAYVLADGTVADVRVVKSIAMLDAAAMAAVRQWRFSPALRSGAAVPAWVIVPVVFDLTK